MSDAMQTDSTPILIEAQNISRSKVCLSDSLAGHVVEGALVEHVAEAFSVSMSTDSARKLSQLPFKSSQGDRCLDACAAPSRYPLEPFRRVLVSRTKQVLRCTFGWSERFALDLWQRLSGSLSQAEAG